MSGAASVAPESVGTFGLSTAPGAGAKMATTGRLCGGDSMTFTVRVCVAVAPNASVTCTVSVCWPSVWNASVNGSQPFLGEVKSVSQTTLSHDASRVGEKIVARREYGTKRENVPLASGELMARVGVTLSANTVTSSARDGVPS